MIHTGMIFCNINKDQFEKFRSHPDTKPHRQDKFRTWVNIAFKDYGITYIQARYIQKPQFLFWPSILPPVPLSFTVRFPLSYTLNISHSSPLTVKV